jgi:hypothetical protein
MLDLPLHTQLHYHFAVEILCIIGHYFSRGPYRQIKSFFKAFQCGSELSIKAIREILAGVFFS